MESIYRFRPTKALLDGYHELERQEIYFASLPELNDPLEGFKDLFWKGDAIVWKNLLRHYLLCFMQAVRLTVDRGPDLELTSGALSVEMIRDHLPPQGRSVFDTICAKFFEDEEVADLPTLLAGRTSPVRRTELLSLLWPLHSRVLKTVCTALSPDKPINDIDEFFRTKADAPLRLQQSFAALNQMDRTRADGPDITEQMTAKLVSAVTQTIFIREYNGASRPHGAAWNVIASSFPEQYLNALERLLYFDWYTACFVADPTQAAMWGNYGDGHRGVCLKFKTSSLPSGQPSLTLRHIDELGGHDAKPLFRPLELHQVHYLDRYAEIDFFRSLGRLTHPQSAFWFAAEDGTISTTGFDLMQETEEWRQSYWQAFHTAVTTKLLDWQHEKEYRVTLHNMIANLADPTSRKLKYQFDDLQGIVFGIKTSTEDKLSIVRIIQDKCKREGRKHFEIEQAYYSRRAGRIATTPWDLLKLG
jgi:hypothetical protein